jgi:hypothetical protein
MDQLALDIFAIEFAIDDMKRQAVEARTKNQSFCATLSWSQTDGIDNIFKHTGRLAERSKAPLC